MIQVYLVGDAERPLFEKNMPEEVNNVEPLLIGAVEEETKTACGVLAVWTFSDIWEILYIEVASEYRRKGIGSRMIEFLKQTASGLLSEGIGCCYMNMSEEKEEGLLDSFFEAVSFPLDMESPIYRVKAALFGDGLFRRSSPLSKGQILPLERISGYDWGAFRERVIRVGAEYSDEFEDDEENTRMVFLDVGDRKFYDDKASHLYLNQDKRATGCILLSGEGEKLSLRYIYMLTKGAFSATVLMRLFVSAFDAINGSYGADTDVYVNTQNINSEKILDKITQGKADICGHAIERVLYI